MSDLTPKRISAASYRDFRDTFTLLELLGDILGAIASSAKLATRPAAPA